MKKKLLIILGIFFILAAGAYIYLSQIFFPIKFKSILADKVEKILHRKVSVGTINFQLTKGMTLKDLTISERLPNTETFLHVDEIHLKLLFTPILKKKLFFIQSVKIYHPEITLTHETASQWNFSDLLPPPTTDQKPSRHRFVIQKLTVDNGQITFNDKSQSGDVFTESLNNLHLDASVSLSQKAQMNLNALLGSRQSPVQIQSNYELETKKGEVNISAKNIDLAFYLPHFLDKKTNILKSGLLNQSNLKINLNTSTVDVAGDLDVSQAHIQFGADRNISGDVTLPKFTVVFEKGKWLGQADLQIKAADAQLSSMFLSKTNIAAKILSFEFVENRATLSGSAVLTNTHLKVGPNISYAGNLNLNQMTFINENADVELSGNVVSDQTKFKIEPNQSLEGNVSLDQGKLSLKKGVITLAGNINLSDTTLASKISDKESISFNGNLSALNTHFRLEKYNLQVSSSLSLSSAAIGLGNGVIFKDSSSAAEFSIDGSLAALSRIQYKGSINFGDASVAGLPQVKSLEHIKGNIAFETDKADVHNLSLQILSFPIVLNGSLVNFLQPQADFDIQASNVDLAELQPLLTAMVKNMPVELTGQAQLNAHYKGALTSPEKAEITGHSSFTNTSIVSSKLPAPITDLSGNIDYKTNEVLFKNIKAVFLNNTYGINGSVTNFAEPLLSATLTANNLDTTLEMKMLNKTLQILKAAGKYFNTAFDIRGRIDLPDGQDPYFDLSTKTSLALSDLKNIPLFSQRVEKLNPVGTLDIDGFFKGSQKDMKNSSASFNASSAHISVAGHPVENVSMRYTKQDTNSVGRFDVQSNIYNGTFTITSLLDWKDADLPVNLEAKLDRLDLAVYRQVKDLKASNLAGIVAMNTTLTGPIKNSNALTGEGSIVVIDGFLGQLSFFDGILGALLVVPQFKNIFITDASINYIIRDGKIKTDNALFSSQSVQLEGKGWVDFAGNINFEVSPKLSQIELAKSDSVKKLPTEILSQAISVKCTGTIDKPQCGLSNAPIKIIEGTTDILKEGIKGVGDILKEIF